jgi:hypothetical protein
MDPVAGSSATQHRRVVRDGPCEVIELDVHADGRGVLVAGETGAELPFAPARFFTITGVPAGGRRAQHANRSCAELLVCTSGSCVVETRWDGSSHETVLDRPDRALHVPAGVWLECRDFTPGAVLLVLASHRYDPTDQVADPALMV